MIIASVLIENATVEEAGMIAASHPDKTVFTYEQDGGTIVKVKGALQLLPSASDKQLHAAARKFATSVTGRGCFRWEHDSRCSDWTDLKHDIS